MVSKKESDSQLEALLSENQTLQDQLAQMKLEMRHKVSLFLELQQYVIFNTVNGAYNRSHRL